MELQNRFLNFIKDVEIFFTIPPLKFDKLDDALEAVRLFHEASLNFDPNSTDQLFYAQAVREAIRLGATQEQLEEICTDPILSLFLRRPKD